MSLKPMIGMLVLFMTINWSCQNTPKAKNEPPVDYLKESKEDFDQRMKWWREARFGMFIHWGVYAVPAGIHNGFKTKGVGEWIQLLLNSNLKIRRVRQKVQSHKIRC